jgi:hypothetical protein
VVSAATIVIDVLPSKHPIERLDSPLQAARLVDASFAGSIVQHEVGRSKFDWSGRASCTIPFGYRSAIGKPQNCYSRLAGMLVTAPDGSPRIMGDFVAPLRELIAYWLELPCDPTSCEGGLRAAASTRYAMRTHLLY